MVLKLTPVSKLVINFISHPIQPINEFGKRSQLLLLFGAHSLVLMLKYRPFLCHDRFFYVDGRRSLQSQGDSIAGTTIYVGPASRS
jgi:hypothetical protein